MGELQILRDKANRGVEVPETVTVQIKESNFKQDVSDYNSTAVDAYLKSNMFRKEFQYDPINQVITFKKTM